MTNGDETDRRYELIALRWWLMTSVVAALTYRWRYLVFAVALFAPFFMAVRLWREQSLYRKARLKKDSPAVEEAEDDASNPWEMFGVPQNGRVDNRA